jgi:hypothetical protein
MAIRFDTRLGRFLDDGMPAGVPREYARPHVMRDQPRPMPLPMPPPEDGYDIPMPKEGDIDPGVDRYGRPRPMPMPLPVGGDGYGGGYGGGFGQKVPILKDDSLYDPSADNSAYYQAIGDAMASQPVLPARSKGGVYQAVGDAMAAQKGGGVYQAVGDAMAGQLPSKGVAGQLPVRSQTDQAAAEAQLLAQMQARGQGKAKPKFSVRSLFGLG